MRKLRAFMLMVCMTAFAATAFAIGPNESLPDPEKEARARALFKELRCVVCQNQSIDDSEADLARDLRIIVRERIQAGDSDEEILDYLTKRYGDFVLLRPPVRPATWPLWFGPFVLLAAGGAAIWILRRRRRTGNVPDIALSDEERTRLQRMLDDDDDSGGMRR